MLVLRIPGPCFERKTPLFLSSSASRSKGGNRNWRRGSDGTYKQRRKSRRVERPQKVQGTVARVTSMPNKQSVVSTFPEPATLPSTRRRNTTVRKMLSFLSFQICQATVMKTSTKKGLENSDLAWNKR
ncbi:hypothetical protein BRADI_1g61425v3 [Brachypodium distachyon]|uniref:Uncharacterized protein n=1 Tax=Brachypodium distachyon TaxID=15368 RepID=A0A2K2DST8_BRADI|nr:hypothetical protein BRADI_1g61425v3 [Brachypodium distachyon]